MVGAVVLLAAGCSGSARLWVIPAERQKINPGRPLVSRYDLPEAYFWTNQGKELRVVLSQGPLSGRRSFDLSLVLEEMPAGYGRGYRVDRRTLRALAHQQGGWRRYASYEGTASVWFEDHDPDTLHGRFRIWTNEQDYRFWMDYWAGDDETLVIGEFRAVRNQARGQELLGRSEVEELKRGPPLGRPRPVTGPPIEPTSR